MAHLISHFDGAAARLCAVICHANKIPVHDNQPSPVSPPTIRDVARVAGVSHMTVSRVINGKSGVRPQTRSQVEDAIRRLRFHCNPVARALSGMEHVRIGLLHRFPNAGHLGEFLVHLLDETDRAHAGLVVHRIASSAENETTVHGLIDKGVRAVIVTPPLPDDERLIAMLHAAGICAVGIGATRLDGRLSMVGIDERAAARATAEHLMTIGHRRIGFIMGHPDHVSSQHRLDGFEEALSQRGLHLDPSLIVPGQYSYLSGLEAAERLLDRADPPTAIFASNDDMAAATVAVAHRRGIDVPADLTVCGFDDSTLATTIWPPLTTIRQPVEELTRLAVKLVLKERGAVAAGEQTKRQSIVLDYLLVRRQSDGSLQQCPEAIDGID
jgi:LacI family transcriptional regulator